MIESGGNTMGYKILIVDDDRELLKMLHRYFTLKNYTIITAENGVEDVYKRQGCYR